MFGKLDKRLELYVSEPFCTAISEIIKLSPESQKHQLKQELWFHGSVSRFEAESMLSRVCCHFIISLFSFSFSNKNAI